MSNYFYYMKPELFILSCL